MDLGNGSLGITLLVMVVGLILKALWDLKHAPNGADVRAALEVRAALDRRLDRIERDIESNRLLLQPLHDQVTRLIDRDSRQRDHEHGTDD